MSTLGTGWDGVGQGRCSEDFPVLQGICNYLPNFLLLEGLGTCC